MSSRPPPVTDRATVRRTRAAIGAARCSRCRCSPSRAPLEARPRQEPTPPGLRSPSVITRSLACAPTTPPRGGLERAKLRGRGPLQPWPPSPPRQTGPGSRLSRRVELIHATTTWRRFGSTLTSLRTKVAVRANSDRAQTSSRGARPAPPGSTPPASDAGVLTSAMRDPDVFPRCPARQPAISTRLRDRR